MEIKFKKRILIEDIKELGLHKNQVIYMEANSRFKIPNNISDDLYDITSSFKDVAKWKVQILEANSGSGKKGNWDKVGYVMFNTKSNEIIPIARADEHRMGYEVMWNYYNEKYKIRVEDYVPLFIIGNHYIYEDVVKESILACEKYISYGGDPDLLMILPRQEKIQISAGDIIKYKDNIDQLYTDYTNVEDKILNNGQKILDLWKKLANLFRSNDGVNDKSKLNMLVRETINTMEKVESFFSYSIFYPKDIDIIEKTMYNMVKEDINFTDLENFVFGFLDEKDINRKMIEKKFDSFDKFTGIKNTMHNKLKQDFEDKNIRYDDRKASLGDIEMFIKAFSF